MPNYDLEDVKFSVFQSKDASDDIAGKLSEKVRVGIIEDIYDRQSAQMKTKDEKITFLQDELLKYKENEIPFDQIKEEIRINYLDIERINYAHTIGTDFFNGYDTIPTFIIEWKHGAKYDPDKLQKWLMVRLSEDTVRVLNL